MKIRPITAYAIVSIKKPSIKVSDVYKIPQGVVLNKGEKFVKVTIQVV